MLLRWSMMSVFLGGCGGGGEAPPPTADASPGMKLTPMTVQSGVHPDMTRVHDALAVRSPEPTCHAVERMSRDPVGALRSVVVHADEQLVRVRAATCLLTGHPDQAHEDAEAWVVDPSRPGLAALALGRLDELPKQGALQVARAALSGPHEDLARARIARARDADLRALVAGP